MRRRALFAALLAASCSRGAQPRDVITIAVPYEVTTLDPHAEYSVSNYSILFNVYEPLIVMDEEMKIRPALAERWESPDALTWIFHLRPSVHFQSGRPLRAADVVASFERLMRSRDLEARSYLLRVSQVRALDSRTVEVRTDRPIRFLLNRLSSVLVIPEGASPAELALAADGTGPYALVEWRRGESIRLRRNELHWDTKPALREVRFVLGRSAEQAAEGLVAGRYQVASIDARLESKLGGSSRVELVRRESLYVKYLGCDLARDATPFCKVRPNPFRNPLVRRAIHLAIDREQLVSALAAQGIPASQLVPRFVFGFDPTIPVASHDAAESRALLKQAGLPQGFDVVLHTRRILSEAALLVREQLRPLGIRVDVQVLPDGEYFGATRGHQLTFWLDRWGCTTGNASELLENAIHSLDERSRFGVDNESGYVNATLDRAIEESAEVENADERRLALQRLMRSLMNELVWIPLYSDQDVYGVDESLSFRPRADSYIRLADIEPRR